MNQWFAFQLAVVLDMKIICVLFRYQRLRIFYSPSCDLSLRLHERGISSHETDIALQSESGKTCVLSHLDGSWPIIMVDHHEHHDHHDHHRDIVHDNDHILKIMRTIRLTIMMTIMVRIMTMIMVMSTMKMMILVIIAAAVAFAAAATITAAYEVGGGNTNSEAMTSFC